MLHDKDGRVVKVYPYGSEEQLRWELVLEYLLEIDQHYLEKLLQKKAKQRQEVEQILAVPDQTVGEVFVALKEWLSIYKNWKEQKHHKST